MEGEGSGRRGLVGVEEARARQEGRSRRMNITTKDLKLGKSTR